MIPFLRLYYNIEKNLKVVLRNYVLIFLLIIGPLLLILLIGFTYGSDEMNDIRIGYYTENNKLSDEVMNNIASETIKVKAYASFDDCKYDMIKGSVHLCAVFPELITEESKKEIIFYYDNSKFNLVKSILELLREKVGITSEQITLETTENILTNIEESVEFMRTMLDEIEYFKFKAVGVREELVDLHQELVLANEDFQPKYRAIKNIEPIINSSRFRYVKNKEELENESIILKERLQELNGQISNLGYLLKIIESREEYDIIKEISKNISIGNNSQDEDIFELILNNTEEIGKRINNTIEGIDTLVLLLNSTENETIKLDMELKSIIEELDRIDRILNKSINITEKSIILLDENIVNIDKVYNKLNEDIEKFSGIGKGQAEQIVKPISAKYVKILDDDSKVRLLFPTLMIIIIMFISIILSNIVVLNEINSSAYFRSLLLPISDFTIIAGIFVTNLIIVSVQVAVLLAISQIKFGMNITSQLQPLIIATSLISTIFIMIGMIIAYFIKNKQTSILTSVLVSLGLFIYSSIIFPIEGMGKIAAIGASHSPLVVGETLLKKVILFNFPDVRNEMYILLIYVGVLAIILYLAFLRNKARS